jgi:hypothetical protein
MMGVTGRTTTLPGDYRETSWRDPRALHRGYRVLWQGCLPCWPERAVRGNADQLVPEGEQALLAEHCRPCAYGVRDGLISGTGACAAFLGERDQAGASVLRVRVPLDVAFSDELVDHLGSGLPRDVEVLRQLGDGSAAGGQPREREAVGGAQVVESAVCYPG